MPSILNMSENILDIQVARQIYDEQGKNALSDLLSQAMGEYWSAGHGLGELIQQFLCVLGWVLLALKWCGRGAAEGMA